MTNIAVDFINASFSALNKFLVSGLSGKWMAPLDAWSCGSLVLDNSWLSFPKPGFELNIAGGLSVFGTDSTLHKLEVVAGTINCGDDIVLSKGGLSLRSGALANQGSELNCSGDLIAENSSKIWA